MTPHGVPVCPHSMARVLELAIRKEAAAAFSRLPRAKGERFERAPWSAGCIWKLWGGSGGESWWLQGVMAVKTFLLETWCYPCLI